MIDNIVIDIWFSWKFASMESIRIKYSLTVDLLKFRCNEKILNGAILLQVTPLNIFSLHASFDKSTSCLHFFYTLHTGKISSWSDINIYFIYIYINYFILFFYEQENFRDQQLSFKTSNKWLPSTNMNQILKKNSPQTTKKPSFNIFTLSYWNSEREREREPCLWRLIISVVHDSR